MDKRPPLIGTAHAYQRWQARAPRIVRSKASWQTALRAAHLLGYNRHGDAIYAALAMALVVRDGHVITCLPLVRFTRQKSRRTLTAVSQQFHPEGS